MLIRRGHQLSEAERAAWLELRQGLWPHVSRDDHLSEIADTIRRFDDRVAFLASLPPVGPIAFAEAALRRDYVNGCVSSPVGFLEGVYVAPGYRKRGAARALCLAVENWVIAQGCTELASDADIGNLQSHRMHDALGFAETERVIFFRKSLSRKA